MENNEKVIEMNPEQKEVQPEELGYLSKVGIVTGLGAVKQLALTSTYVVGIAAGLVFGKKAGFKTIGTIVGAGAVYNAARYIMGDMDKDK